MPAASNLREVREELRSVVGVDDFHLDRMTWAAERIDRLEHELRRAKSWIDEILADDGA